MARLVIFTITMVAMAATAAACKFENLFHSIDVWRFIRKNEHYDTSVLKCCVDIDKLTKIRFKNQNFSARIKCLLSQQMSTLYDQKSKNIRLLPLLFIELQY